MQRLWGRVYVIISQTQRLLVKPAPTMNYFYIVIVKTCGIIRIMEKLRPYMHDLILRIKD